MRRDVEWWHCCSMNVDGVKVAYLVAEKLCSLGDAQYRERGWADCPRGVLARRFPWYCNRQETRRETDSVEVFVARFHHDSDIHNRNRIVAFGVSGESDLIPIDRREHPVLTFRRVPDQGEGSQRNTEQEHQVSRSQSVSPLLGHRTTGCVLARVRVWALCQAPSPTPAAGLSDTHRAGASFLFSTLSWRSRYWRPPGAVRQ